MDKKCEETLKTVFDDLESEFENWYDREFESILLGNFLSRTRFLNIKNKYLHINETSIPISCTECNDKVDGRDIDEWYCILQLENLHNDGFLLEYPKLPIWCPKHKIH